MANNDLNFRIFKEHVWEDFQYTIHSQKNNVTYYVCKHNKSRRCNARGKLQNGIFTLTKNHIHLPNFKELKERAFQRDLCNRVTTQEDSFRKIYDDARRQHPEAAVSLTFHRCENAMYRWRQSLSPPSPQDLPSYCQIINTDDWKHLKAYSNGELEIVVTTAEDMSTSVIFVDVTFAESVCENGCIFLDATYKVVPTKVGGYQFLTLMAIKYNHALPFAWALMNRKTTAAYVQVFRTLKGLVRTLQINEAMTDYETALQEALRREFLHVLVHGCNFHYCQALFKKMITLGLLPLLQTNADGYKTFRQLMSLPLLPVNQIRIAYGQIVNLLNVETRQALQPFLNYYENQWLRNVTPEVFCVHRLTRRTNNVLESYHRTLKDKFGVHSNIWTFTNNLTNLQEGLKIDLESLRQGYQVNRLPKLRNMMKEQLLKEAWSALNGPNAIDNLEFLDRVTAVIVNPLVEFLRVYGDY